MSNYLIESSICLAVFYSFYWVVLHREKLLNINRFYLLASVMVSLIVPLLNIETHWSLFPKAESAQTIARVGGEQFAQTQSAPTITLGSLYLIGLAVAFTILIVKLVVLSRKLGPSFSLKKKHIDIIEIEGQEAFSFYNTIYIGHELAQNQHLKEQVIAHEFAHIDGKHTLDTLFFELLKCFYWFNPFSYFYCQSVQLQHEFIADQFVLKKSDTKIYERSLLELALLKISPGLVASFNQHPIQKRLKMMKTINSNIMKRLKPLFALPVLGALVFALACTEDIEPTEALDLSTELISEEKIEIPFGSMYDTAKFVIGKFILRADSMKVYSEEEIPVSIHLIYDVKETPIGNTEFKIKSDKQPLKLQGNVLEVREIPINKQH
mgnify:CR=1 FL=1